MRKLLLLLLFFYGVNSYAQDPRLFEIETWYLHDLLIDGNNNVPPTTVHAVFETNGFLYTWVCTDTGGFGTLTYEGIDKFYVEELNWLAGSCPTMELDLYSYLYGGFWNNDLGTVPYDYEIMTDGDDHTLSITSAEGNLAIYGNKILGLDDLSKTKFSVSPNPTSDNLYLQLSESVILQEILIYDIYGKLLDVPSTKGTELIELNTTNLTSGLYFVRVVDKSGQKTTMRFIKR